LFNEINARKIHSEMNVFEGIFRNWIFVLIWVGTFASQILIVQFGGYAFQTAALNIQQWAFCIGCGAFTLIWNFFVNRIPEKWLPGLPKCCQRQKRTKVKKDLEEGGAISAEAEPEEEEEDVDLSLVKGGLWVRGLSRVHNQTRVIRALQDGVGPRSKYKYSIGMRQSSLVRYDSEPLLEVQSPSLEPIKETNNDERKATTNF